jgi:hypothetical protein
MEYHCDHRNFECEAALKVHAELHSRRVFHLYQFLTVLSEVLSYYYSVIFNALKQVMCCHLSARMDVRFPECELH